MQRFRKIVSLIVFNWRPLVLFELIYKVFAAAIMVPVFLTLFTLILKTSGTPYLTYETARTFFAHPLTDALLVLLLLAMTMYSMIDIGAVIFILDQSAQNKKVHTLQALTFSLKNALRVWHPKNIMIAVVILFLVPLLNIGMASGFISTLSLPEFMVDYIRNDWRFLIPVAAGFLLIFYFLCRWLYAFHYFTLEKLNFRPSRGKSRSLGMGNRLKDLLTLLVVQAAYAGISAVLLPAGTILTKKIMSALSSHFILQWLTSTVVATGVFVGLLITFSLAMPVGYGCISVLFYLHKEEKGEPVIPTVQPGYIQDKKKLLLIHRIGVLLGLTSVFTAFLIGVLVCSGLWNPQVEYLHRTEITAHRGASVDYPENTMAAFRGAYEQGADWVELDVRLTKDKQVVVMHDANVRRTTGKDALVSDMTYDEISLLDAGSSFSSGFAGETVPLLGEVIAYAKPLGLKLNIELKTVDDSGDLEKAVLGLIHDSRYDTGCQISSLLYDDLTRVKALDPDIRTSYILTLALGQIDRLDAADGFCVETTSANRSLVKRIHNAGKTLTVWTVNQRGSIEDLIDLGIDNIITDNVPLAKDCLTRSRYSELINRLTDLLS